MKTGSETRPDREELLSPQAAPFLRRNFEMQSTPRNVAIIMDGNRRWAATRGLPAVAGHRAGARALEALLPALARTGIRSLTLFGFSAANWQRSRFEVEQLLALAESQLRRCTPSCVRERLAVEVIGRRDRLPQSLLRTIDRVERATANGTRRLRIAFDYSSRHAICDAASTLGTTAELANADALAAHLGGAGLITEVDLLIRTGKEQRLSDFLLWECAFAELYFPDLHWPDFDVTALDAALAWFGGRERRMGR